MTTVVDIRHSQCDLYIGRANSRYKLKASIWANPFKLGKDGTRDDVLAKYRAYVLSRSDLVAQLPTLRGKRLGCWCVPLKCHGHVLVELLDELYPV